MSRLSKSRWRTARTSGRAFSQTRIWRPRWPSEIRRFSWVRISRGRRAILPVRDMERMRIAECGGAGRGQDMGNTSGSGHGYGFDGVDILRRTEVADWVFAEEEDHGA